MLVEIELWVVMSGVKIRFKWKISRDEIKWFTGSSHTLGQVSNILVSNYPKKHIRKQVPTSMNAKHAIV